MDRAPLASEGNFLHVGTTTPVIGLFLFHGLVVNTIVPTTNFGLGVTIDAYNLSPLLVSLGSPHTQLVSPWFK